MLFGQRERDSRLCGQRERDSRLFGQLAAQEEEKKVEMGHV